VTAIFVMWLEVTTRNEMHAFAGGRPYIKRQSSVIIYHTVVVGRT